MKKLMIVMLALAGLMISVPVVMARDANWSALNKVWSDQVKQENQQIRTERLKADSDSNIVVPDRTKFDTAPGLQRPSPR